MRQTRRSAATLQAQEYQIYHTSLKLGIGGQCSIMSQESWRHRVHSITATSRPKSLQLEASVPVSTVFLLRNAHKLPFLMAPYSHMLVGAPTTPKRHTLRTPLSLAKKSEYRSSHLSMTTQRKSGRMRRSHPRSSSEESLLESSNFRAISVCPECCHKEFGCF